MSKQIKTTDEAIEAIKKEAYNEGYMEGRGETFSKKPVEKYLRRPWVARDKNGELYIYRTQPVRYKDIFTLGPAAHPGEFWRIEDELFPKVTWENSPIKLIPEYE